MTEQPSIFDNTRYTFITKTEEYAEVMEDSKDEFTEVDSEECLYSPEYTIAVIQPISTKANYTVEDIMDIMDAIAVHEEFTNAIITSKDKLEELSEIYPWQGGGLTFIGDMLTDIEKLSNLLNFINQDKSKPVILCDDIKYSTSKNGELKPLSEHTSLLFGNIITNIQYDNKVEILHWPTIIEKVGYYLGVIDEDLDFNEDDDEPSVLLPALKDEPKNRGFGPSDYPWSDDEYDYWGEYGYYDDFRRY